MGVEFTRREHIRRRAEFEQVYDTGGKASGRFMTVFVLVRRSPKGESGLSVPSAEREGGRNSTEPTARLGIAATRKIGGAVVRNRAKRVVRELFRHGKPAANLDIVVVPRRELLDAPFDTLGREFTALVDRARRAGRHPRV